MKLVLKQDVDKLGHMGDVVEVKPGYGRNFLLARGLAAPASEMSMRQIEAKKRQAVRLAEQRRQELQAIAEQLANASCTIAAKANEEGHLFGSVSAKQIAEALAAEGFTRVEEAMIVLEEPLRQLGVFDVPVQVAPELKVTCKVWIVQE